MATSGVSPKENERLHALHNGKVCDALWSECDKGNQYYDWVITTAFYSALKWVRHYLFPLSIPANTPPLHVDYNALARSLDEYCVHHNRAMRKIGMPKKSIHGVVKDLVSQHFDSNISDSYRTLYDLSQNARYVNYRVGSRSAELARQKLNLIQGACQNVLP